MSSTWEEPGEDAPPEAPSPSKEQVCHYQVTMKVGFRLEEPSVGSAPGEQSSSDPPSTWAGSDE
jgi:hypothetical protein